MENEDGEEKEEEIVSFAVVPLADVKRLMACLNGCTTPMHYVPLEEKTKEEQDQEGILDCRLPRSA